MVSCQLAVRLSNARSSRPARRLGPIGNSTYGELSGGSSSNGFASSSSISSTSSSSVVIYGEDAGVSCVTGFPGTARPVANENLESAPIPISDVAKEGRRLCASLYRALLLRRRRRCCNPSFEGPSAQLSKLALCNLPGDRAGAGLSCRAAGSTSSSLSSDSSWGIRTAPYDDEPSAGDVRRRGARDMKPRKR